jgi:hypothetical protein
MPNETKVDFINPTVEENEAFWKDIKAVCEKHSMVLGTGFSIQKAVKLQVLDKKDVA